MHEERHEPDDVEVMHGIASGGATANAFKEQVFTRHFRKLCRMCRMQFPSLDENEASDIVCGRMMHAFERAATYRGKSSLYSWLYAMVRNAVIDYLRVQKRLVSLSESDDNEDDEKEPDSLVEWTSPLTELERAQLVECVAKRFAAFRVDHPEAATAIYERHVEGADMRLVAEMLGRQYGAARQFVSKEVVRLRKYLAPCAEFVRA